MNIYNIEMSSQTLSELIDMLTIYTVKLDNYDDIEEAVHMIDFLEEQERLAQAILNDEYRRWTEWQYELSDFIKFLQTKGISEEKLLRWMDEYNIIAGTEQEEWVAKDDK